MKNDMNVSSVGVSVGTLVLSFFDIFCGGEDPGETSFVLHSHAYYEIQIIAEGTAVFETRNGSQRLSSGTLIVIPSGCEHFFPETDNCRRIVFAFSLSRQKGGTDLYSVFRDRLEKNALMPLSLHGPMLDSAEWFTEHTPEFARTTSFALRLHAYAWLLERLEELGIFPGKQELSSETDEERRILLDNLTNDLRYSLPEIAMRLGYSVRHTERVILEAYGCPLTELRQKRRLESAEKLLRTEHAMPLSEISMLAGFSGISSFYRVFAKAYHMTPDEYRKTVINNQQSFLKD